MKIQWLKQIRDSWRGCEWAIHSSQCILQLAFALRTFDDVHIFISYRDAAPWISIKLSQFRRKTILSHFKDQKSTRAIQKSLVKFQIEKWTLFRSVISISIQFKLKKTRFFEGFYWLFRREKYRKKQMIFEMIFVMRRGMRVFCLLFKIYMDVYI